MCFSVRLQIPQTDEGKAQWRHEARVAAVLGSCPRSVASLKSGFRNWVKYICYTYPEEESCQRVLPPLLSDVVAWSCTFRCFATYSNYLGYLRGVCAATGHEPPPVGHPAIRRAMTAVAKRGMWKEREKMHIQRRAGFCLHVRFDLSACPVRHQELAVQNGQSRRPRQGGDAF